MGGAESPEERSLAPSLEASRSYDPRARHYRGVWGLYGSYEYLSPQLFRLSTTALSLGTTAQLWLTHSIALQGSILGGMGYAAVGTLRGRGERDYHYGVAPAGVREPAPDLRSKGVARPTRARVSRERHRVRGYRRP